MNEEIDTRQDWITWGFRMMFAVLTGIAAFYLSQISESVKDLNIALKAIDVHLNETDRRVLAIEVAREISGTGYKKLLDDFESMKIRVTENSLHIMELKARIK